MKIKVLFTLTVLISVAFLLAACGSTSEPTIQESADEAASEENPTEVALQDNNGPRGNGGQGGLPTQMLLAAGTLKLEETDLAVTVEQAAELLPLWKAARSLADSDNITNEEINAIYDQIEEAMTTDQMGAIEAMELSFEDLSEVFPDMQMGMGSGQFGDVDREAMQATREAMGDDFQPPSGMEGSGGGRPEGGIPGGDGGGPQGGFGGGFGNTDSDSGERVSPAATVYDPVIELLESKLE
ncbi:MAG: hypothetical protein JXB38_21685 [Anaerolineales bacterium]|nr:hypothetical protein [Anaerolineales bacterium]